MHFNGFYSISERVKDWIDLDENVPLTLEAALCRPEADGTTNIPRERVATNTTRNSENFSLSARSLTTATDALHHRTDGRHHCPFRGRQPRPRPDWADLLAPTRDRQLVMTWETSRVPSPTAILSYRTAHGQSRRPREIPSEAADMYLEHRRFRRLHPSQGTVRRRLWMTTTVADDSEAVTKTVIIILGVPRTLVIRVIALHFLPQPTHEW